MKFIVSLLCGRQRLTLPCGISLLNLTYNRGIIITTS